MAIETAGKNLMAEGIKDAATLSLQAWDATALDSQSVTFDAAAGGVIDISSNVTFTLTTGENVATVRLYSVSTMLASVALTTNNDFPAGGELIVTKYEITVT